MTNAIIPHHMSVAAIAMKPPNPRTPQTRAHIRKITANHSNGPAIVYTSVSQCSKGYKIICYLLLKEEKKGKRPEYALAV
jgi:hypothetical protein